MGLREDAKENRIKAKAEEGLRSKMKAKALKECKQYLSIYAECAQGRTFSVVWRCRQEAKELNECLHQYTNDQVFEEYKRQYVIEKKE